ncbi:MAG: SprT family zinc-dependent metalloprotease [Amphritea sp.]
MFSLFRKSTLDYQVRRSNRRKTVAIEVRRNEVRVLAPTAVSDSWIDSFVAQKEDWIKKRLAEFAQYPEPEADPVIEEGSRLMLLGQSYSLHIRESNQSSRVEVLSERIVLHLSGRLRRPRDESIKQQLEGWYRQQAQAYIEQRVSYWAEVMNEQPSAIKVRSYRRKWGCCNSRGELRFNWLLIMAPPEIIDYVVIHELSHLKHMNHSARFWQRVVIYCKDFKQAQGWLKQEGYRLNW